MNLPRRLAFTLVELLLAVVVFVMVSSFALVTLATTVKLQMVSRQNQQVSLQAARVMEELAGEIRSALSDGGTNYRQGIKTMVVDPGSPTSPDYPNDSALFMVVPGRDSNGLATSPLIWKVYCAESSPVGKRIVRLTFTSSPPPSQSPSSIKSVESIPACDKDQIATSFNLTPQSKDYLTDAFIEIKNLRFWPVYSKIAPPAIGSEGYDPPAVKIELTAAYNTKEGPEQRASEVSTVSPPNGFDFGSLVRSPFILA